MTRAVPARDAPRSCVHAVVAAGARRCSARQRRRNPVGPRSPRSTVGHRAPRRSRRRRQTRTGAASGPRFTATIIVGDTSRPLEGVEMVVSQDGRGDRPRGVRRGRQGRRGIARRRHSTRSRSTRTPCPTAWRSRRGPAPRCHPRCRPPVTARSCSASSRRVRPPSATRSDVRTLRQPGGERHPLRARDRPRGGRAVADLRHDRADELRPRRAVDLRSDGRLVPQLRHRRPGPAAR